MIEDGEVASTLNEITESERKSTMVWSKHILTDFVTKETMKFFCVEGLSHGTWTITCPRPLAPSWGTRRVTPSSGTAPTSSAQSGGTIEPLFSNLLKCFWTASASYSKVEWDQRWKIVKAFGNPTLEPENRFLYIAALARRRKNNLMCENNVPYYKPTLFCFQANPPAVG